MTVLRIDYGKVAPGAIKGMLSANAHFDGVPIQSVLRRLVELRVSQINGCAYCIWLHTKQAHDLGETTERLESVEHWQTAACFHPVEIAAFRWAEAVTRIAQGTPSDAIYNDLRQHFDDRQVVELTGIIANMNALNRMAVSFRHEPPDE